MRNLNEPCKYPHQFFQNSFSSPPPKTGSSSRLRDATDDIPNDFDTHLPPESPSKKAEPKEKESSDSSPPKDSSSTEKVHIPLPHFSHRFKNKDQAHVEKMR